MTETKQLLDLLRDSNPGIRRYALERLGEAGDRMAVAALRRATDDEDSSVATQAERSLYLLVQRAGSGPGSREKVVSFPGVVGGQLADVFEIEPLQECGRRLLRPHARRLARSLLGPDAPLARVSATSLGKLGDVEFIPQLAQGLDHEDRRHECAYALAGFREPTARTALVNLLDRGNKADIRLGVFALCGDDSPEPLGRLLRLTRHPDNEVRVDAIFALGESGDRAMAARLAGFLDDGDDRVVIRTLAALRKLGYAGLLETLLTRLPAARNHRLRATMVAALEGAPSEPAVLEALQRAITDPDTRVRANAVEVIGSMQLPKEQKLELLRPASDDTNNRVLANLAIALGHDDPVHSLQILSEMLNSEDKWERASAVYAAGFIREERVGDWLANIFMFEEDADVLRNTVSSLTRMRGLPLAGQLSKALRHHNPAVRSGAAAVMGALEDRACRESLLRALEAERDERVRSDLLSALGKLCDTSHIPHISAAMQVPSSRVQARGLEALEQIGSVEILPHVEPFLSSLDPRVKANAARALWKLGQLDVAAILGGMMQSSNTDEVVAASYALGELGIALDCVGDLRQFYLLASALRARMRETPPQNERLPEDSRAQSQVDDILRAEAPLRHVYAGRYAEAINCLQAQLQETPGSPSANYLVGDLYRRLGNLELAHRHFETCAPGCPEFVNLDLHQASVTQGLDDTPGSIRHYLSAMMSKIEIARELAETALRLLAEERVGDASLLLKALVQQVPIDSKIHYKVGVQMLNHGLYDEALSHLHRALLAEPKDARVLYQLAVLMAKLDQKVVLKKLADWVVDLLGADDPLARQIARLAGATPGAEALEGDHDSSPPER